jgi:lysozyme family protein
LGKLVFDRRDVVRAGFGAAAGLFYPGIAAAQTDGLADMLGVKLPPELIGLLPAKEVNLVKTLAAILQLERTADRRGLPKSALSFRNSAALPTSQSSLYQAALPRLVSVIDRSEEADPGLADQAGEILADVNATQHVVPDALKPDAPKEPAAIIAGHDFAKLKGEYASLFASAQPREEFAPTLSWHFEAIKKFRPRYEALSKDVGVPWYFIGAIHGLESSFNFRAHFHNGDYPLSRRTRQVPAGRPLVWGPPSDWESSAKDALKLLGFTGQSDWSLERMLYRLEAYNGFGYRRHGVATPYIWSFSSHYNRGKFVRDGRWSAEARSEQCGAGIVIKALADAGEIKFA